MARFRFLGKPLPILGVVILILLPLLGATMGIVYPGSSAGGFDSTGINPLSASGPESSPSQPSDSMAGDRSTVTEEPAVVINSSGKGIRVENSPNKSQVTVRDDGTGFWFSTQTDGNSNGSTIQLWLDINNTASVSQKIRIAVKPESPLEVGDKLSGSPSGMFTTRQQESMSGTWIVRVPPEVTGEKSVTNEPIISPKKIKYRTNRAVVDRDYDHNVTTADISFVDADMTDSVDDIDNLQHNDDGTATLYLNGSTDTDETYDMVSYRSGGYLVIPVHVPEDAAPGTYTIEGEIQTPQQ